MSRDKVLATNSFSCTEYRQRDFVAKLLKSDTGALCGNGVILSKQEIIGSAGLG